MVRGPEEARNRVVVSLFDVVIITVILVLPSLHQDRHHCVTSRSQNFMTVSSAAAAMILPHDSGTDSAQTEINLSIRSTSSFEATPHSQGQGPPHPTPIAGHEKGSLLAPVFSFPCPCGTIAPIESRASLSRALDRVQVTVLDT